MWRNAIGTMLKVERLSTHLINNPERQMKRWVRPTLAKIKSRRMKEMSNPMKPLKINPRNTYFEWNHDAELYAFGKRLNEEFNLDTLRTAFTFRSYVIQEESRQKDIGMEIPEVFEKDNYELIEKGEYLMSRYIQLYLEAALPNFPSDGIVAIKDHLMTEKILSSVSFNLGTKDIILSDEYPVSENILAQTFKAIVGALIESSGEEKAAYFIRDFVIVNLNGKDINEIWKIDDPLQMLKDILNKSGKTPELRLIQEIGKNTLLACYKVGIYIDKEMFCAGYGENLKTAQDMAAREGLKIVFGTQENMAPIDFKIPGIPDGKKITHSEKKQLSM